MANKNYDRNKPKYEWGDGWTKNGVTEKQLNYIQILVNKIAQRSIPIEIIRDAPALTRGAASGLIDELKRVADYGDSTKYLMRDWSKFVTIQEV